MTDIKKLYLDKMNSRIFDKTVHVDEWLLKAMNGYCCYVSSIRNDFSFTSDIDTGNNFFLFGVAFKIANDDNTILGINEWYIRKERKRKLKLIL